MFTVCSEEYFILTTSRLGRDWKFAYGTHGCLASCSTPVSLKRTDEFVAIDPTLRKLPTDQFHLKKKKSVLPFDQKTSPVQVNLYSKQC